VRIPLADFGNFNLVKTQVRGVRLIFDQTPKGAIYVADIRFSNTPGSGMLAPALVPGGQTEEPSLSTPISQSDRSLISEPDQNQAMIHHGRIVNTQTGSAMPALLSQPGVEIEVFSEDGFPVRNAKVVLQIGKHQFFLDRYQNGDLHTLIFTLTNDQFAQVATGDPVRVQYGTEPSQEWWDLGYLDKNIINQNQ
jgi:hypothetical protein